MTGATVESAVLAVVCGSDVETGDGGLGAVWHEASRKTRTSAGG